VKERHSLVVSFVRSFVPFTSLPSRYSLRSASYNQLTVPAVKLSSYEARAFSGSGPAVWNRLPTEYLRGSSLSLDVSRQYLKTFLFAQY